LCLGPRARRGFTLLELLVVIGVMSLLIVLLVPPLDLARKQAMQTTCMANMRELGKALTALHTEFGFYPIWDDGGSPTRFTWVDVLIQRGQLGHGAVGYCPSDLRPDGMNEVRARAIDRNLAYPGRPERGGTDYSYGIAVPLSAGGWAWQQAQAVVDGKPRRFEESQRYAGRRVLAADGWWPAIYNLGSPTQNGAPWNFPTQYDNTLAYRHANHAATLLCQDGHVSRVRYGAEKSQPVDTVAQFVWYPGEPLFVGPDARYGANYYPCMPPLNPFSTPSGDIMPREVIPAFYTQNHAWTVIPNK
jgi:prepilin-type N-terminal cleavage/methylation domain-containing protein